MLLESIRPLVAMAALALCAGAFDAPSLAQDSGADGEAPSLPRPEFKSDRYAEDFDKALEKYKAEDYKSAHSSFKKAIKGAKDADDKKVVDLWMTACEGGIRLGGFQKMVVGNHAQEAVLAALDLAASFKGTPIESKFQAFLDAEAPKVLLTIEEFDHPSASYSEKYGKEHVKADPADPKSVFSGAGCLKWSQTADKKAVQLRFEENVPKNWTSFEAVVFWIKVVAPQEVQLIIRSPGKDKNQTNSHMVSHRTKESGEWQRVLYPLDKFRKYGKGTLASVDAFLFQMTSKANFEFYIDRVSLIRKQDGAGAAK